MNTDLLKEFGHEFENQLCRFKSSTVYSIATVGMSLKMLYPFSTIREDLSRMIEQLTFGDDCLLMDGIRNGVQCLHCFALSKFGNKYGKAKLRLVLVTCDGGDLETNDEYEEMIAGNGVIIDCLLLGKRDGLFQSRRSKVLAQCCHRSGGTIVQITDKKRLTDVLTSEAFLAVQNRYVEESEGDGLDTEFPNAMDHRMEVRRTAKPADIWEEPKTDRIRRLQEEIRAIQNSGEEAIKVDPMSIDEWRVALQGPKGTPYERRWFRLLVVFPELYPIKPPQFKFLSVPFHININHEGRICLDILEKNYRQNFSVRFLLVGIISLLAEPNYDDPIEQSMLMLYQRDRRVFEWKMKSRVPGEKPWWCSVESWLKS